MAKKPSTTKGAPPPAPEPVVATTQSRARGARRTRLTVLQLALMGKGPIMRAEKELSKASSKTKR